MVRSRTCGPTVATFTILAPSSAGLPMVGRGEGVGLAVWDAVGLDVAEGENEGEAASARDADVEFDGPAAPEQAATPIARIRTPSCTADRAPHFIE
jgi:hypothetical protein